MPKIGVIVLLLASCCGIRPVPQCFGASGMEFDGPNFGPWDCEYFQSVDGYVLEGFKNSETLDGRLNKLDNRGWKLFIQPADSWVDEFGRTVYGLTYCKEKVVYISIKQFGKSSITHEYVHAGQNCKPLPPIGLDEGGHSNWERDGINDMIKHINGD
jgi:hypothetical protein